MDSNVQLPQFTVRGFRTSTKLEKLSTGQPYKLYRFCAIPLVIYKVTRNVSQCPTWWPPYQI